MKLLRHLLLAAVACSLLAAVAGSALGQGATPTAPCGSFLDKAGDVPEKNLDITEWWFETKAGKVTANLRLNDLNAKLPSDATGINWYILWTGPEDVQYFVTASAEAGQVGVTFAYGQVEGNIRQQTADIPGKFIEGPGGVIQWIGLPAETGAKTGAVLKAPIADTKTSTGVPGVLGLLSNIDDSPGKSYTVAPCPGGAAAPTPEPGATPGPTPAPSATPAPTGPQPSQQTGAAGQLDVKLAGKLPAAKKIKKSLAVKLKSVGGATGVKAALFLGDIKKKKIVATGKVARVGAKTTLKMKVKKKLKKGKYTLYLIGKNANGQTADRKIAVRLR